MWVYGTLPTSLTRLVADIVHRGNGGSALIVGRALSGIFDLIACLALFVMAGRIYGRRVALLAAALYAFTVMPIQQSHFFTTDNFATAFTTLALVAAVQLGIKGRWRDALLAGLFTGPQSLPRSTWPPSAW